VHGGGVSGWAEVLLSLWLQISVSLAEECEPLEVARPPRSVAGNNDLHRRYYESFKLKLHCDWGFTGRVCAS
jgi:hypothetical protein